MAKPELLVDQAQCLVDGGLLVGRDLDVGKARNCRTWVVGPPDPAQFVLGPAARRGGDDLAVAGALAGPARASK
jgi:hypothetical protein